MSELIKKFSNQCKTQYHDGNDGYVVHFDENKFFELVVQECLTTLKNVPIVYKNLKYRSVEEDTILDCIAAVEKHLGVKG